MTVVIPDTINLPEIISAAENSLPEIAERPKVEILAWEKEAFGFYMSGNPLDEFAEKFSGLIKIEEILRGDFTSGKLLQIGGLIIDSRQITTKKGDSMANITLEDFSGKIGVTIFPNVFEQCRDFILADAVTVVKGKVDYSGERVKIVANEISLAQNYTPDIYFDLQKNLYEKILSVLKNYSGKSSVYFKIGGKWKIQNLKVEINKNLREELKKLLGAENFRIY